MSECLTPLDATFLELEEADESAHMHIGGALIFEPPVPSLAALVDHLRIRLGALPRYRQRLSQPHTGRLTWPSWIDDEAFDVANHVHRAALPQPGGEPELSEWLGEFWSQRLDRRRPLWEMVLLEGLADGRWALCTKTHHCMVDGVGSIDVGHVLLDASPEPGEHPPAAPPAAPEADHGLVWRTSHGVAGLVRSGLGAALHPERVRELLTRSRGLADLLVRDELIAAPGSSVNVPIGTRRRYLPVTIELDELKGIKRELGGTVNDAVLAVVTGGLRRLLLERDEDPPGAGLRAMVPMNVRTAGERMALGNRISSLFVHLPVASATPRERYASVTAEAEQLKGGSQAAGGALLVDLAGHMPPVVHAAVARSLFASRLFNVTVTNVPGPQIPLYAFGSRMTDIHGLVPLAAEHCVGVCVLSYAGQVSFGLIADRDTVPDLDRLAAGMRAELAELRELAHRGELAGSA
jgi:diacylglycerol O-acyltransferase / wax synthase